MEISGASSSAYDSSVGRTAAADRSSDADDTVKDAPAASDTVDISPEAARLAARERADSDDGDASGDDKKDDTDDGKPSVAKSVVYGALGLERPEEGQKHDNDGYSFGRWIAAGVTIGSIISVLI